PISSPTTGTRWPSARMLEASCHLITALLILIGVSTFVNLRRINASWNDPTFSHEVGVELDTVLADLKDAETGQRGFLLTGDERAPHPYRHSLATTRQSLSHLRTLTAGHRVGQDPMRAVDAAITAKLAELATTIGLHREKGFDAALAVVRTDRGQALMDRVRDE